MSVRRKQQKSERYEDRAAKHRVKQEFKRHGAPGRIRGAATACFIFAAAAILGGILGASAPPEFGGDAYTEIVAQLATISGAVAWLAAAVLFTGGALLRALAEVLDELRRPSYQGSGT